MTKDELFARLPERFQPYKAAYPFRPIDETNLSAEEKQALWDRERLQAYWICTGMEAQDALMKLLIVRAKTPEDCTCPTCGVTHKNVAVKMVEQNA